IVASKIVEKYHKPAFLMMYSEETKQIRCSARGVEGVSALSLYDIISNISDKLDGFGGHTLAAGFSFNSEIISFDDVKKGLIETIDEALAGEKIIPILNIDMELKTDNISIPMIEELKQLEPYGAANPQPLFILKDLILKEKKLMGSNKEHLKLIFEKDGQIFNAIWWSKGDISLNKGDAADIAFFPQINTFNGNTSIQLILKDLHSEALTLDESQNNHIKIYDHRSKLNIFKQVNDYLQTTKLNTGVFVEDKSVMEQLKPYPEILKRIFNRNTIKNCESLMFFDYPPSGELYELILTKSAPSIIHYMNYSINHSIDEYLKTLSGMIRFVCNNKKGVFEFNSSATFLGVTEELIQLSLELLAESGLVSIIERDENYYILHLLEHGDIINIETLTSYTEFNLEYTTIKSFKQSYQNIDLNSINVCMV
ncbi:MAG: DHHA1 domain-containing protein, partial [Candidatus Gastranaerophilaceae bacterium]